MTATIDQQFDTAISVFRLVADTGAKRKYDTSAVLTTVGAKMPAAPEDVALLDGAYSEVSRIFTPRVDIRKSDKLVIGGADYFVAGVEDFDRGTNQHLELVIYQPD